METRYRTPEFARPRAAEEGACSCISVGRPNGTAVVAARPERGRHADTVSITSRLLFSPVLRGLNSLLPTR